MGSDLTVSTDPAEVGPGAMLRAIPEPGPEATPESPLDTSPAAVPDAADESGDVNGRVERARGEATAVACDVSVEEQVRELSAAAEAWCIRRGVRPRVGLSLIGTFE